VSLPESYASGEPIPGPADVSQRVSFERQRRQGIYVPAKLDSKRPCPCLDQRKKILYQVLKMALAKRLHVSLTANADAAT